MWWLNAGQKYCRILYPWEYSAMRLTCIKRLSVLKTYFWSSFGWPLKTDFTVMGEQQQKIQRLRTDSSLG